MTDWILDTSVIAKWVLPESDSPTALRVASDVTSKGGTLFALDLALIEATNVIWTRIHRKLLTLVEARQALTLLLQASIQILPGVPLLSQALEISAQHDIAVYDALLVAAVRTRNCGGVTADEPLVRAVGNAYPELKLLRSW